MRLPNVLFIGPDKSGSTWIADLLVSHPEVFVPVAKDLYFFTDQYERGIGWYEAAFRRAGDASIVAEVCHDYLFSTAACERIAQDLPEVRLLVVVRRPSDRAFSSYLHMRKHGLTTLSFEDALQQIEELVDHGRYATHLEPYVERFGRDRIWIGCFDDLREDPAEFASSLFLWLGVQPPELDEALLRPRLSAARPRSVAVAYVVKLLAIGARARGMASLVGRVKRSASVQRVLYRSYGDRPRMDPTVAQRIDSELRGELLALEAWGFRVPDPWIVPDPSVRGEDTKMDARSDA